MQDPVQPAHHLGRYTHASVLLQTFVQLLISLKPYKRC